MGSLEVQDANMRYAGQTDWGIAAALLGIGIGVLGFWGVVVALIMKFTIPNSHITSLVGLSSIGALILAACLVVPQIVLGLRRR